MKINHSLPIGTVIEGKDFSYKIIEVLGQGAFGITYKVELLGKNGQSTDVFMAMKEFFMKDFNGREGLKVTSSDEEGVFTDYRKKFLEEAQKLTDVRHDNIVSVKELFEANNTVYYIRAYVKGDNLDRLIDVRGQLSERETLEVALLVCKALEHLHNNGLIHLDVKPDNIMMISGKVPVMVDFGLSKTVTSNGEPETSTRIGIGTRGYAPLEQSNYSPGKGNAEAIDVYALCASIFRMLTGERPAASSDIFNNGFPYGQLRNAGVSEETISVVSKGMSPAVKDRYPDIISLENDIKEILKTKFEVFTEEVKIDEPQSAISESDTETAKTPDEANIVDSIDDDYTVESEKKKLPVVVYALSALGIIVAGLILYFFLLSRTEEKIESEEKEVKTESVSSSKDTISTPAVENVMPIEPATVDKTDIEMDSESQLKDRKRDPNRKERFRERKQRVENPSESNKGDVKTETSEKTVTTSSSQTPASSTSTSVENSNPNQ